MAKTGLCHCTSSLSANGQCPYGCSPWADPEHLRLQAEKRRANDNHRRGEDHWTITVEEHRRMNTAIAKFDPFFRRAQKKAMQAAARRYAMGGKR